MAKRAWTWKTFRTWVVPPLCVIGGIAIGAGFMAWQGGTSADPAASFAASQSSQSSTASLETIEKSVSATGTLSAADNETVAFEATGRVTAVDVAVGDTVAKGDVLATIDSLQLTADYQTAKAELAQAEATLADLEDAADGSDSSDAQIASAEASVEIARQAAKDAKADMANAQLVAPFDGLVTAQTYAVGDAVSGGSSGGGTAAGQGGSTTSTTASGVTIVGQNAWSVSVSLTADEVDLIEAGDQVNFTADDVDAFFGVVDAISALPSTDSGTATYPVTLVVTGTPTGLFEGVSATADIVYLRKTDVLTVPTNAITTMDGASTVIVVADDGTEETRTVTLGESSGSLTEITDGLTEGENVKVTVFAQGGTGDTGTTDGQFQVPDGFQPPTDGQFPGGQQGTQQGGNG